MGDTGEDRARPATESPSGPRRPSLRPSRAGIAALLTLLLPGLGQAWLGSVRRGLVLAAPLLLFVGVLAVAAVADFPGLVGSLVRPGAIIALLLVVLGLAAWHLAAIDDTYRVALRRATRPDPAASLAPVPPPPGGPERPRRPRRSPLLAMALVVAIGVYGGVELLGYRAYEATTAIFIQPSGDFEIPTASFEPEATTPPGTGLPTPGQPTVLGPTPTPGPAWAQDGRLNLLLIGTDAGPGRWLARMDAMVVLSVDIASGRAALFSIPRYIANVPLAPESAGSFPNGIFHRRLTALYVWAVGHPNQFPGKSDEARGFRAVTGAVQELVGVPLDGVVAVNLNGFVDLVDAIGGLWVDIPSAVYDAHYPKPDGSGYIEIYIKPGCRHLDGERALEYARSRHQDGDIGRLGRQQRVLVSLARQVDPIALLPRAGDLLDIAKENLWTTIDVNEIANLAVLAARVDSHHVQTFTLAPPDYPTFLTDKARARIRTLVRTVFETPVDASPSASPEPTARPCPRP